MMPRPRSRRRPLEIVALEDIAAEIRAVTEEQNGAPPVAVVVGNREWIMCKRQVDHRAFIGYWPGGEETVLGIPVIVRRTATKPVVVATQPELEDMLLGA